MLFRSGLGGSLLIKKLSYREHFTGMNVHNKETNRGSDENNKYAFHLQYYKIQYYGPTNINITTNKKVNN